MCKNGKGRWIPAESTRGSLREEKAFDEWVGFLWEGEWKGPREE